MNSPQTKFLLTVACLSIMSTNLIAAPTWSAKEIHDAGLTADWLTSYTEALVRDNDWAGASTAVTLPDGTTVRASAGQADMASGEALTINHRLLGGSTGKTYVAALILMLEEDELLRLDDPVSQYLGHLEWFARLPNAESLTVLSLLNHSSGIGHYIDDWDFITRFSWDRLLGNDTAYSLEEMISVVLDEAPAFPVGKGHLYSDLNYFLLGLILEEISGRDYYAIVQQEILDYLDLEDTLPSNKRRLDRLATGYVQDSLFNRLTRTNGPTQIDGELVMDPAIEWTGGGFATTPGDLARFYYHLGRGSLGETIDSQAMISEAVSIAPDSDIRYGMGVFVSSRETLGEYISHSGWYPGYITNAAYFQDHDFSVAIQVNQDGGVDVHTATRELALQVLERLPAEPVSLDYVVLVAGEQIGLQQVTFDEPGLVEVRYGFTSQGKHADIRVQITTDAQGIPSAMQRSGRAFLYYDIDEQFITDSSMSHWQSTFEEGSSEDYADRYYVTYNLLDDGASAPAESALIAAAALRNPGGEINLLPRGQARAATLGWMKLAGVDEQVSMDTQLVALHGLGFSPERLWLDSQLRPFAEHSGGSVIRGGWEHARQAQTARQLEMTNRYQKASQFDSDDLAQAWGSGGVLLRNIAVYDSKIRDFVENQDVLIKGQRIAAIGTSGSLPGASSAHVLKTSARYLIPGFWDMHVHLNQTDLIKHLAWGVTTVRDLGNNPIELDALHDGVTEGRMVGPDILRAGFIDKAGPRATAAGVLVDTLPEALAAIDNFAERGYQQIKLYGAIEADWVRHIAQRAHSHGMRLGGHVPIDGTTERAIADGYDEIQHFIYLWLNFAPSPVDLELTYNTARLAMQYPPGSPALAALIAQFANSGTALDPTLAIYSDLLEAKPGELKRSYRLMADDLPLQVDRAARSGALPTPDYFPAGQLQSLFDNALQLVGEMHEAGVDILVGTDHRGLPGAAMHAELELLSLAGIPNGDILHLATSGAANIMGMAEETGSIAPAQRADLLLLLKNPIDDIRNTTSITHVIKGGVLYERETLRKAY